MRNLFGHDRHNALLLVLSVAAGAMVLIRRTDAWLVVVAAVGGAQVAVWILATRGLPGRFIVPLLVPLALLAGWLIPRWANDRRAGLRLAGWAMLAGICGWQLVQAGLAWRRATAGEPGLHGANPRLLRMDAFAAGQVGRPILPGRWMLIGDARAWLFPPGSIYATTFDRHPLAAWVDQGVEPEQIARRLGRSGVRYVWVNWAEIHRLAGTYGHAPELTPDNRARPGSLPVLDALESHGLRRIYPLPQHADPPPVALYRLDADSGPPPGEADAAAGVLP
jgi:hypothetical protein